MQEQGDSVRVYWDPPILVSNDGTEPPVRSTYQPGGTFLIGSTPVKYKAKNGQGAVALCTFTVTVRGPYVVTDSAGLNKVLQEWVLIPGVNGRILFTESDASYQLGSVYKFDFNSKATGSLTLDASGATGVTILADGYTRHFRIGGGATLNTIGLTFTGGKGGEDGKAGSMIVVGGGTLNVVSTVFRGNQADDQYGYGGAVGVISTEKAKAVFTAVDSEFDDNSAGTGGAVFLDGTTHGAYPFFNATR